MDVARDHPDNVVQKLTRHRCDGELWFKVRWLGFSAARDTWQTASVLTQSCPQLVMQYYRRQKTKRTPELIEHMRENFPAADLHARLYQPTRRQRDFPIRARRTRQRQARPTSPDAVITQPAQPLGTPRRGRPRKHATASTNEHVDHSHSLTSTTVSNVPAKPTVDTRTRTRGRPRNSATARGGARGRGRGRARGRISRRGHGRGRGPANVRTHTRLSAPSAPAPASQAATGHGSTRQSLHTKVGPRGETITLSKWQAQQKDRARRAERRNKRRDESLLQEQARAARELAAAAKATAAAAASTTARYPLRSRSRMPGPTKRVTRSGTRQTSQTSAWRLPDAW